MCLTRNAHLSPPPAVHDAGRLRRRRATPCPSSPARDPRRSARHCGSSGQRAPHPAVPRASGSGDSTRVGQCISSATAMKHRSLRRSESTAGSTPSPAPRPDRTTSARTVALLRQPRGPFAPSVTCAAGHGPAPQDRRDFRRPPNGAPTRLARALLADLGPSPESRLVWSGLGAYHCRQRPEGRISLPGCCHTSRTGRLT